MSFEPSDYRLPARVALVLGLGLCACGEAEGASNRASVIGEDVSATSVVPSEAARSLPTLEYLDLAGQFENLHVSTRQGPCLYVEIDGRDDLLVFPTSATLSRKGVILFPDGSTMSEFASQASLGGGEMIVSDIRTQGLAFDPRECEYGDRVFLAGAALP